MAITLAELKQQSRERADMVDSAFIADSEQTSLINNSIAELHDIITLAYGNDYNVESYTFSTSGGTADYSLPSDFYKLKGVDMAVDNGNWSDIKKFNFNDRNNRIATWDGVHNCRYRLVGSNLKFSPTPESNIPVQIWYTPKYVQLSNSTDEMDDINGYGEYVIVDVAIKMKMKQEDDVSALMKVKGDLLARIQAAAEDRDTAYPETITDVTNGDCDYYLRWR